jgi:sugar lactone lactonase YvrE
MSTDRDLTIVVRAWLDEGVTRMPDHVLDSVLHQLPTTHQRRARWPAWRFPTMSTTIRLAVAAAAISLFAVVVGIAPRANGPGTTTATSSPTVSPTPAFPPMACPSVTALPSGTIGTIAGGGTATPADGSRATDVTLTIGQGLAVDAAGNVYVGDSGTKSVLRIRPAGVIETFASGFTAPSGLAFDAAGNLYVTDNLAWIKKIDPSGVVTTVAGTGVQGSTGDGGPALDARIQPASLAVGPDGSLYFDDNNRYRMIDPSGVIHAFAGTGATGSSGDGGPATDATFGNWSYGETGVAVGLDGSVYLGDGGNYRIRKVNPTGTITTAVGGLPGNSGDGGPATSAKLDSSPYGLATDQSGDLYIADWNNANVRKVDATGTITSVAGIKDSFNGIGQSFGDCGPAAESGLDAPQAVAVHDGAVFIGQAGSVTGEVDRIRMVLP